MIKDTYLHKLQRAIPISLFVALESLSAMPAVAGDGVVILEREVPVRPAIREGSPGRAVSVDTSPDDKVKLAVGQISSVKPIELDDASFAAISSDSPRVLSLTSDASKLSDARFSSYGLGGASSASSAAQPITPMIAGATGGAVGAVGAATGQLNASLNGATSALGGLTGAIMRSSGQ